jgi:hypothetical protein
VVRAHRGHYLLGWDASARVGLHGVVDRDDGFFQPALDRGVAFLEGA